MNRNNRPMRERRSGHTSRHKIPVAIIDLEKARTDGCVWNRRSWYRKTKGQPVRSQQRDLVEGEIAMEGEIMNEGKRTAASEW